MMTPVRARPCPSSSGFALIRESAMWPQTIPAMAAVIKNPQQNPKSPSPLKIRDRTASCSVFRCGTIATGATGATGVAVGAADVTAGETGEALAGAAALTPGTVESAAQPAAP